MKEKIRILKIGIASEDEIRERVLAIAGGKLKPKTDDPKVWVRSRRELAALLSDENAALLDAIRKAPGSPVGVIADKLKRKVPSVSRSLGQLSALGLVSLPKDGRNVVPEVLFDRVELPV